MPTQVESQEENVAGKSGQLYSYYVLFVLTMTQFFASLDRYSFSIFLQPIKKELGASDTEMGLLAGLAFVVVFALFGIPMALWVDRGIRRRILAISVAAWSIMIGFSGMAVNTMQMAISRLGLGIGETGSMPCAMSLIGDYFPKQKRPWAISIHHCGVGLSAIIGAPVAGLIAQYYGWRGALLWFAAAGLLLAVVIMLTVREPVRGAMDPTPPQGLAAAFVGKQHRLHSIRKIMSLPAFRYLFLSQIFVGTTTGIMPLWFPAFLIRNHGFTVQQAALAIGFFFGAVTLLAYLISGAAQSYLLRITNDNRWSARLPGLCCLASVPFIISALMVHDLTMVMVLSSFFFLFLFMTRPVAYSMALELTDNTQRGMAAALILLANGLIGATVGPLVVGMISDHWTAKLGSDMGLGHALLTIVPIVMTLGGISFLLISGKLSTHSDQMQKTIE